MFGTKKKLMAAVVMLVISAIMMTSASYAWFTFSTKPEITDMTTQVVTNENLEIMLATTGDTAATDISTRIPAAGDTGNQYTWGNIVDLSVGTAATAYAGISKVLRPSTLNITTDVFQYPTYGSDGRVNAIKTLNVETMTSGFGTLTDDNDDVYGYYVDFWLRSNVGGAVTLSAADNRSSTGAMGGGTVLTSTNDDILNNILIAFQPGATGDITAATATVTSGVSTAYAATVTTLAEDTAQLVRMYVYYEGAALTNADALIGDALVDATLNIQFAVANVDSSMDKY
jgi:hypothetical protein